MLRCLIDRQIHSSQPFHEIFNRFAIIVEFSNYGRQNSMENWNFVNLFRFKRSVIKLTFSLEFHSNVRMHRKLSYLLWKTENSRWKPHYHFACICKQRTNFNWIQRNATSDTISFIKKNHEAILEFDEKKSVENFQWIGYFSVECGTVKYNKRV